MISDALVRLVDGLDADESADECVPPSGDPELLAASSTGLRPGSVRWAHAVADRMALAAAELMGPEVAASLGEYARHGVELAALDVLRDLRGEPRGTFVLPPPEMTMARTMAQRADPYQQFLRGLRVVQDVLLSALLAEADGFRPVRLRTPLVLEITRRVTHHYDAMTVGAVDEYLAERERIFARAVTDRRVTVDALIAGRHVQEESASRLLRIDLSHLQLGLIVWDPQWALAGEEHRLDLGGIVRRLASAALAEGTLSLPAEHAHDAVLVWLTRSRPFAEDVAARIARALEAHPGARAAIGVVAAGAAGFRKTHLTALDTERLLRIRPAEVVLRYEDAALDALITQDAERVRWFVEEELGRLAEGDASSIEGLRRTAYTYLESGRSLVRTAEAMHIHRNTVVYRLGRVEELLGHPIDARPLATQAALAAIRLLPGLESER